MARILLPPLTATERRQAAHQKIAELVRLGEAKEDILELYEITESTLRRVLKNQGVLWPWPSRAECFRIRRKEMADRIARGEIVDDVVKHCRTTVESVRAACKEYNVPWPFRANLSARRKAARLKIAAEALKTRTIRDVRREYEVTHETCRQVIREFGIDYVTKEKMYAQIVAEYLAGDLVDVLAARHRLKPKRICTILRKYRVAAKKPKTHIFNAFRSLKLLLDGVPHSEVCRRIDIHSHTVRDVSDLARAAGFPLPEADATATIAS